MPPEAAARPEVRDAATVILVRRSAGAPEVLMGQRGGGAAFMPDKFVFPGGAVDPEDALLPDAALDPLTAQLLALEAPAELVRPLAFAAVRELWEETGLMLGLPDARAADIEVPASWRDFYAAGLQPNPAALRFVFRAVTPPGRPRRFDARFFVAEAAAVAGDDLTASGDELAHLQWLTLAAARALPLPFITEVVLSELEALLDDPDPARPVPYFSQASGSPEFRLLRA